MSQVLEEEKVFESYLKWLVWVLIPLFLLGFVQYYSPEDAFINRYATEATDGAYEVVKGTSGRVRITGTFSYLATYASFLCFILHLLSYATILSVLRKKLNFLYLAAFGLAMVNIFMTGSRGPTGYYVITEGLALLYLAFSGHVKFLKNVIPLMFLFGVLYLVLMNTQVATQALADFLNRISTSDDLGNRLEDTFDPFKFSDMAGPIGYGIGTAQNPMAPYLTNRQEMPGYWEEEGERIVIELGIIGYLIVMFLRITIFISCFKVMKSILKLEYKILALQMTMFQIPFLLNLQTNIFNYIDGIFYWMAVGLVYFAAHLDSKAKKQLEITNNPNTITPNFSAA